MSLLKPQAIQDRTAELGLGIYDEDLEARFAQHTESLEPPSSDDLKAIEEARRRRAKIEAGRRRKENLKTNFIVATIASVFVLVLYISHETRPAASASSAKTSSAPTSVVAAEPAKAVSPGKP